MPQPHVTIATTTSLDGRTDPVDPKILSNRLEQERLAQLRTHSDAILTSAEHIMVENPQFILKESKNKPPAIVVVDKTGELPRDSNIIKSRGSKLILATCNKAASARIKRLQDARSDLIVWELGEYSVNLEDTIWELHRAGMTKILVEGDDALNMKLLNLNLVDQMYLLLAPMILGEGGKQKYSQTLDRRNELQLEGIIQYGDHLVLHYNVLKPFRK
jgi:riboflavin-specific deaminase-like protein